MREKENENKKEKERKLKASGTILCLPLCQFHSDISPLLLIPTVFYFYKSMTNSVTVMDVKEFSNMFGLFP